MVSTVFRYRICILWWLEIQVNSCKLRYRYSSKFVISPIREQSFEIRHSIFANSWIFKKIHYKSAVKCVFLLRHLMVEILTFLFTLSKFVMTLSDELFTNIEDYLVMSCSVIHVGPKEGNVGTNGLSRLRLGVLRLGPSQKDLIHIFWRNRS